MQLQNIFCMFCQPANGCYHNIGEDNRQEGTA